MEKLKNVFNKNRVFYTVVKNNNFIGGLSITQKEAKRQALSDSKYRWTEQNLDKVWRYMEKDGWKVVKVKLLLVKLNRKVVK